MSSRLALTLSTSALVVALLGSTSLGSAVTTALPRNSVGPLQLKRNAVGPQKVAPNAIRTAHVLDGSLLAADFKAGQIPAGPKGDPGPPGASGRQVVTIQSAQDSSSVKELLVSCPQGKVALGGGASIAGLPAPKGIAITQSNPNGDQRWKARAEEVVAYAASWILSAYVVCAKVT